MMVDREKTIDGFAYWIDNEENGVCHIPFNLCKKVLELIKEQPEQKKGHWILNKKIPQLKCSECGSSHALADPIQYCDRCGAMMNEKITEQ